jgi:hypothetical protein
MTFHSDHHPPTTGRHRALLVAGHMAAGVLLAALLALVFGWIVAQLWNRILPDLLGARTIGYWQSVGLILMTRILVGGFHHGHGRLHGRNRRHCHGKTWSNYDEWWEEVGEKSFREFKDPQ